LGTLNVANPRLADSARSPSACAEGVAAAMTHPAAFFPVRVKLL